MDLNIPGAGSLSVGVTASPTLVGAGVDYEHRLTESMSLFNSSQIGYDGSFGSGLSWKTFGGFRWRF